MQGGSSADQVNQELFAPGTAGDYLLKGTLTVYYTYFSAFNTNTDSYLVNNVTFTGLKEALLSYAQAALELAEYEQFEDDLSLKYSLSGIQNVVLDYSLPFYITESVSEDIAKQDHFDIPLTVVGATVNVEVENYNVNNWTKNLKTSVGDDVRVRWLPKNSTSCTCTYNGTLGDCGTSDANNNGSHVYYTVYDIKKPITFSVHCDP